MNVHEATANHLRQIVLGPVVVWELARSDDAARALAVAHVVNTWHRPDMFTVALGAGDEPEAATELAADLNLTRAWVIASPESGQREALAERAVIWLGAIPAGSLTAVAEALAEMLDERAPR